MRKLVQLEQGNVMREITINRNNNNNNNTDVVDYDTKC